MAEDRSSFDLIGKAFNIAKIYSGSNTVNKLDAIIEAESLSTLGDFVRDPRNMIETKGIDFDEKSDDRLQKYNIVKITPTKHLDDLENPMEIYLITDEHGHDIGTYEVTENGPVFKLSSKIQEHNETIQGRFRGQAKDILENKYKIESLETLVEKLSKGENIALVSEQQAKRDINNEYTEQGMKFESDSMDEISNEDQDALDSIPADMRGEAVEFAKQHELKVKDILIVDSPKELAGEIDNRDNQVSEYGGPVILIRANHGGADSLGDDVYAFQDGHAIQSQKNDDILENLMNQHQGEGQVKSLNDDEGDNLEQEVVKLMTDAIAKIEEKQEKIAQIQYNMQNFETDSPEQQDEIFARMNAEIDDIQTDIHGVIAEKDYQIRTMARERYPLRPFDEQSIDSLEETHIENKKYDDMVDDSQEEANDGYQKTRGEQPETIYDGH